MSTVITKPKIQIEKKLLAELKTLVKEERQVLIHCLFDAMNSDDCLIRIWPTTFLYATGSAHRSELVYADNITMFPTWTLVPGASVYSFSLLFTGLPSDCSVFDFVEEIPENGGFKVNGIKRNNSDVYFIKV